MDGIKSTNVPLRFCPQMTSLEKRVFRDFFPPPPPRLPGPRWQNFNDPFLAPQAKIFQKFFTPIKENYFLDTFTKNFFGPPQAPPHFGLCYFSKHVMSFGEAPPMCDEICGWSLRGCSSITKSRRGGGGGGGGE